jgi:hypothetical protein
MHALGVLCSGAADMESTGYLFIAFKPDLLSPLEDYRRALGAEIAAIKATPRQRASARSAFHASAGTASARASRARASRSTGASTTRSPRSRRPRVDPVAAR